MLFAPSDLIMYLHVPVLKNAQLRQNAKRMTLNLSLAQLQPQLVTHDFPHHHHYLLSFTRPSTPFVLSHEGDYRFLYDLIGKFYETGFCSLGRSGDHSITQVRLYEEIKVLQILPS